MDPSTPSIAESLRLLETEQREERMALTVLRGATFTDCLKINHIPPTREVLTPKGKTITLRGSDIYHNDTWHKFLAHSQYENNLTQLTAMRERLAEEYRAWLLSEHTARYQALSTEEDLAWLKRVVTLAVTRRIMEQKYESYSTQGLDTFADPHVASEMGNLLMLNHLLKEAARLVHHVVKSPEQAQELIAQFYQEHDRQMQVRALLTREAPQALLPGATTPSEQPMRKEEESDE